MKMKVLNTTLLFALTAPAFAGGYVGIYGVDNREAPVASVEQSYEHPSGVLNFGYKTPGSTAVGAEIYMTDVGAGAGVAVHQRIGGLTFSLGRGAFADKATGQTSLGVVKDTSTGYGNFVGVSYKIFHVRAVRYDVSHSYIKTAQVGETCDGEGNRIPIFATSKSGGDSTREQLWVGVQFGF